MNAHRCQAHRFGKITPIPWPVCMGCGLVLLRNAFTAWAAKVGCCNELHTEHTAHRRATTNTEGTRV